MVDMPVDPTLTTHIFFFWIEPGTSKVWLQRDDQPAVSDTYSGTLMVDPRSELLVAGRLAVIDIADGVDVYLRRLRLWAGNCINFSESDRSGLYNSGNGLTYAEIAAGGVTPCGGTFQGELAAIVDEPHLR